MNADRTPWHNLSEGGISSAIRELIERIDSRIEQRKWTEGYFGKRVVGDDTSIKRLKESGRVQARHLVKIEKFLDQCDEEERGDNA